MRMAHFHCCFFAVMIALLGGTSTQVAADLVIDEFDEITTGDWPLFTTGSLVKTTDLGLASVFGGRRVAMTNISSEPVTPGIDWIRANVDTDRGLLEYANSIGAPGLLSVVYHVPSSFDLGDFAGLRVDFADVVLPHDRSLGVGIALEFDRSSAEAYQMITTSGQQSVFFPFDDFAEVELGIFDLADATSLVLFLDGSFGASTEVERIVAYIPEPGSISLLGIGGACLLARSFRSRKS